MELVATFGPAVRCVADARALREAGATTVRINGSHVDPDGLERVAGLAIGGGFERGQILIDLQGGKTRLGSLPGPVSLLAGEELRWVPEGQRGGLPVDRPAFLRALREGDRVWVDDARYSFVVRRTSGDAVTLVAEQDAVLKPRKGLALPARPLELEPAFVERDRALIERARSLGLGQVAVSYATRPAWLERAREALPELRLVAKLEQPASVDAQAELAARADSLWFCRGDLGAEGGLDALPGLLRRFLTGPGELLVAGQVLHHMTVSPRPTRSEICHVGDLVAAGVAGFVLSDETATGRYGVGAVRLLRRLGAQATGML